MGTNGTNGYPYSEEEIEVISADAIRAVREPLEQLEEALIWLAAANDAVKAGQIYSVWSELNREKEQLVAALIQQEIERANRELMQEALP